MTRTNYFVILLLFVLILTSCVKQEVKIKNNSFMAFSLREAQNTLKNNSIKKDSTLLTLGGITRISGMVIDRQNNDIILVGKRNNELPKANFDDFVVALRARLVHNELPMVSIDPNENTDKTGIQEVRFGGQIENTSFGSDLLESDIFLKKYSLELEQQVEDVYSYKKLLLDDEIEKMKTNGILPTKIHWISYDSIYDYHGNVQESESVKQSRFWFNYKDPYQVRIRGNVFCITALDIIVEKEVKNSEVIDSDNSEIIAADQKFADSFSSKYYLIGETNPIINKLKLLFDMTAIAEGLKKTKDIPDVEYLKYEYQIAPVENRKNFELIRKCAVINRNDNKISLIQLSGGIETSVEINWLNSGDVGYLENIVLKSRPSQKSLFWKLPLDEWEMPNSHGIIEKIDSNSKKIKKGFSVTSNSVVINNNALAKTRTVFNGFSSAQPMQPVQTKGVQMRMEIDTMSFQRVDSLAFIRDKILEK